MQVIAFSTPARPDWRWRIVDYAGEVLEESHQSFPSIATAVTAGGHRLRELGVQDLPDRASAFARGTSHFRNR